MKTNKEVSIETALPERTHIPFEKPKENMFNYGMPMFKQGNYNHIYFIGHCGVDIIL